MHVVIASLGTRGDAQPYIALAKAFQAKGHRVTFACSADHRQLSESNGVPFREITGSFSDLVATDKGRAWLESGDSVLAYLKTTRALFHDFQLPWNRAAFAAAEDADLVLGHPYVWGAFFAAEKRGVPYVVTPLWPFVATGELPIAGVPTFALRWLRRLVWRKGIEAIDGLNADARATMRRELALSEQPSVGFYAHLSTAAPWIHLVSETLVPRPRDWPANVTIGGACTLEEPAFNPPADLVEFLANGPAPIYLGFGSMTGRDPEALTRLAVGAIAKTKQRAVIVTGWGGVDRTYLSGDVLALDTVPHDWLFSRVRAVVHHGGAGTTVAGLRAGRPTQVVSFFGDQPTWGLRVAELGAGPKPLHRTKLTTERLTAGITQLVSNDSYRVVAEQLASKMATERNASDAAEMILKAAAVS